MSSLYFQVVQAFALCFGLLNLRTVQLPSVWLPSFELLNLRPVHFLSSFEFNGMLAVSGCLAVLVLAALIAIAFVKPSPTSINLTLIAPPKRFSADHSPLSVANPLQRSRQQTSQPIRQSPGEAFPIKLGVSQLFLGHGHYHQSSSSMFSRPSTQASSITAKLEQITHNVNVDQLTEALAFCSISRPDVEPVIDSSDAMSISSPHVNELTSFSISVEGSPIRTRRAVNNPVFMPIPQTAIVDSAHNELRFRGQATPAKPSQSHRAHTSTAQRKVASRRRRLLAAAPKKVTVCPSTPPTSTLPPRAVAPPATPVKPSSCRPRYSSTSTKKVASRRRRLATALAFALQKAEVSLPSTQTSTPVIFIRSQPRGILKSSDSSSARVPKSVHFEEFQVITVVPRTDDDTINWPFQGTPYQAPHPEEKLRRLRLKSTTNDHSAYRNVSCGSVGHNRVQRDGKWCCSFGDLKVYRAPVRPRRC